MYCAAHVLVLELHVYFVQDLLVFIPERILGSALLLEIELGGDLLVGLMVTMVA
jgi:hypothetical protein